MDIFAEAARLKQDGSSGVMVTVVGKEGHGPALPGAHLLLTASGDIFGTVGGGALEQAALLRARQIHASGAAESATYLMSPDNEIINGENTGMMCGGSITLFYEYIGVGPRLFIFGAGHIGRALSALARNLGYFITILDCREKMAETIPSAHRRITVNYPDALNDQTAPENGFFVIATHSHPLDYVALKRIVSSNWRPKYVGMIASRKKAPSLIRRLKDELGAETDLSFLYSPTGLNTGGVTPDEIALSIAAELQAVRYGKTGNQHMRDIPPA